MTFSLEANLSFVSDPVVPPVGRQLTFTSLATGNELPNARLVSIAIHGSDVRVQADVPKTSIALMQFGQFLDHDLTLTPQSGSCDSMCGVGEGMERNICCEIWSYDNETLPENCWPIPVDKDDPLFGPDGPECLEFKRSQVSGCLSNEDPVQFNEVTHFVDASTVYGSTEEQTSELRAGKGGLLRLNQFSEEALPFELNHCVNTSARSLPLRHPRGFQAGDIRVNENPGLQMFHTLWAMEHNRLATKIYKAYPDKTDDEVFEESRRYLIAEWQNTVIQDFLAVIFGKEQLPNLRIRHQRANFVRS